MPAHGVFLSLEKFLATEHRPMLTESRTPIPRDSGPSWP